MTATCLFAALLATCPQPQEPQQPQQQQAIARAVADLHDPGQRANALAALQKIGAPALPVMRREFERSKAPLPERLMLRAAFDAVAKGARLFAFAEPVTLVADYSDNRVFFADGQGEVLWKQEDVFGAWDAEVTPKGTLLITEFSVSRVQELDRTGKVLWSFEDLKNPYDADRLPNGNTLIADTFGSRVIEVSPDQKIVWSYGGNDAAVRPFDADRLPNGNTLISDVLEDRVIEVSPAGAIVWQYAPTPSVHDADRLANGNTLITLRNQDKVIEVTPDGKKIWELARLEHPSDADRLPNGNTLIAENQHVREFDKNGKLVRELKATWAVEANRY